MGPTDENRSLPPSASPYDDRASLSRLQTAEAARLRPRASLSLIPQAGARSRISLKPRPTKPLVSPRPHVKLGQSTTVRPAVEVELPTSEPSAAPSSALASSSPDRSHLSLDHALGLGTMNPVASTSTHTLDPPHTIKRQVGSSLSVSKLAGFGTDGALRVDCTDRLSLGPERRAPLLSRGHWLKLLYGRHQLQTDRELALLHSRPRNRPASHAMPPTSSPALAPSPLKSTQPAPSNYRPRKPQAAAPLQPAH